jgi:hypothetical protein
MSVGLGSGLWAALAGPTGVPSEIVVVVGVVVVFRGASDAKLTVLVKSR